MDLFEGALHRFVWWCLTWICLRVPYIDLFEGALHAFVWGCLTWICLAVSYLGSFGMCSDKLVSRTAMVKPMSLAGLWNRSVNSLKSTFPSWLASTHIIMYSISSLQHNNNHMYSISSLQHYNHHITCEAHFIN